MEKMVSWERARELIFNQIQALPSETIEIHRAINRVLAQDAPATVSLPSAQISFRDGYALRSQDSGVGKKLRLSSPIFAGNPSTEVLQTGEAVWIATGAVIPEGADAVIEEEKVKKLEGWIELAETVAPGLNLREEGEEFKKDEILLKKGILLAGREISLLIAGGYFEVEVIRKPRLWVVAIGDELRHPGTVARPGQVYPSAGWLAAILSEELGCNLGRVLLKEDDPEALMEAIPEPAEADLVITVGGTGFGRKDIIIESLEKFGVKIIFQGIKIRPGHSLIVSKKDRQLIFSLPGRISASEICFELLVRPAIFKMQGKPGADSIMVQAKTKKDIEAFKDQKHILRGKLERKGEELWVEPMRRKSWHQEIVEADGLIIIPENRNPVKVGEPVSLMIHPHRLGYFFPTA